MLTPAARIDDPAADADDHGSGPAEPHAAGFTRRGPLGLAETITASWVLGLAAGVAIRPG